MSSKQSGEERRLYRDTLLIDSMLRECNVVLPSSIYVIISSFAKDALGFDINCIQKKYSQSIIMKEYNRVLIKEVDDIDTQAIIIANKVISAEEYDSFSWEIELHQIAEFSYIGWVNAPTSQSIKRWHFYLTATDTVKQFAIYFIAGSDTPATNGCHQVENSFNIPDGVQIGDIFTFKVDFKLRQMIITHNRDLTGRVIFSEVSDKIIPAVSRYECDGEYTIRTVY